MPLDCRHEGRGGLDQALARSQKRAADQQHRILAVEIKQLRNALELIPGEAVTSCGGAPSGEQAARRALPGLQAAGYVTFPAPVGTPDGKWVVEAVVKAAPTSERAMSSAGGSDAR